MSPSVAFLQRCVKIRSHIVFGFEMLGHIPLSGLNLFLFHGYPLYLACQFLRSLDILPLRTLFAPCQQDDQRCASLNEYQFRRGDSSGCGCIPGRGGIRRALAIGAFGQ